MSRNAEPRRRLSEASGGAGGLRSDGGAEDTSHRSVPPIEIKTNDQRMNTNRPPVRATPASCSFCDGPAAPKGAVRGRALWWCEACGVGFHADGEGR